ncbi:hypothetical protein BU24DRAFT_375982 [Aaosphaeria arxii CBS 175.79]|uniref:Uncharacterized protein n=1 Tax=Aaosphaeria arxii CBS 175.79 TaxID=1450172 RepID=A0A6A5XGE8_9PLEO|nr:uncharacterized protein BU24DRAFT_375982 [Aaosphaeria arxii CBS 175.79]KAF2012305.1 hypothetical protein BU24DRAFT_375982 [Aaosphaeria arxii CBS 175.79]
MAYPSMESEDVYDIQDLKHALRTANLELALERSRHAVETVAKDEELRKLRVDKCLLHDRVDEISEELGDAEAESEGLEFALDDALQNVDQLKADAEIAKNQIRTQSREIGNLKAELKAMENVTSDTNKILSEKLALTREMSSLKPEVEHLRAQVESNHGLLAEKLTLQRQLATLQVEIDNEKRSTARALAKSGKKTEQEEELRTELEEIRNELVKEKKDRLKAEAALAKAEESSAKAQADVLSHQQASERIQAKLDKVTKREADKASKREEAQDAEVENLQQELQNERNARQKAERMGKKAEEREAELEQLREEFGRAKREISAANKVGNKDLQHTATQIAQLENELDEERRERKKMEKEYQKALAELQGRNTVLDDKLNAFRDKLRSTKEKLKETEGRLERAESEVPQATKKAGKNPRKRMASTAEPDSPNLGTPGDGFPTKKTKRATSVSAIGENTALSLTPFLKRQASVAPGETILGESDDEEPSPEEATPTAPPKKAIKKSAPLPKVKPLAPSASNKANAKPAARKKTAAPSLEMVTEEASEVSESKDNSENVPVTVPLKDADDGPSKGKDKALVPKIKPRKSLMSFAAFNEEPVAEKKKKRKLGAGGNSGLGKTLFDADEDVLPAKPNVGKGLFAARALGKGVFGKGPARPISGGYNMMSEENFTFSPLKKDRRGASFLK